MAMFDGSNSANAADWKGLAISLATGLLIAGSCFALLFAVMARFMPLFYRFIDSPYARLLPLVNGVIIPVAILMAYLRRRAKRAKRNVNRKAQSAY